MQPESTYRVGLSGAILIGIVNFHEGVELTDARESGLLDVEGFQRYFAELSEDGPVAPSFAKHGAKLVEAEGSTPLTGGAALAPTAAGAASATVAAAAPAAAPPVEPGSVVEFEVSALDLTSIGAPANTELAVTLNGEQISTVPVSGGAAHVRFTVPDALAGQEVTLRLLASPSGTVVQRDFAVAGEEPGGDADGGDADAGADGSGAVDGGDGADGAGSSSANGASGAAGDGAAGGAGAGAVTDSPSGLSSTGSDVLPWLLASGGTAILAALLVLAARLRRRQAGDMSA